MEDNNIISEYFLELSSSDRLHIIKLLKEKNYRVSQLAKIIDSTSQETHRNLARLLKFDIVEKTVDGKYRLTEIGKIFTTFTSLPWFIHCNKTFFKDHALGKIPNKFIKRLGALESCERINGISKVLEKWKSIYSNATKFIYDITPESMALVDKTIMSKIHEGVRYNHIIPKNHNEEDERPRKLEKLGYYDALDKKLMNRKIINSSEIMLVINEKESAVILPDKNNNPDMRTMFYGKDKYFHEWCVDLFEYYWKLGKTNLRKPEILIKK